MNARKRAASEAKGRWLAYIDDDNVPAKNWVREALLFAIRTAGRNVFWKSLPNR